MRRWLWLAFTLALLPALAIAVRSTAAAPNVSVSASAQPTTVTAGGEVLYTITAANAGDQDVQGLVMSATLPAGFAYIPGSVMLTVNSIRVPAQEPAIVGRTLTWHRLTLPAARANTTSGMHTFIQDRCSGDYINYQLDRVRDLAGPGAYVKQLLYRINSSTSGPDGCWVYFVNAAYDRGLVPVVRLQGEHVGAYWAKPLQDLDGSYTTIAQAYKRVVAGLPLRDGHRLYVEIWNEPNLAIEWSGAPSPAQYGRFLVDTAAAIRSLGDPRIVVLNGALAPGGDLDNLAFIDALAAVPGALQAFDVWASHPYPANHPPEYNIHNRTAAYNRMTIDSYRLELDRLAAHGRTGLRVLLTETGYALGSADYGFEGYPRIDEANRADYISRALRDYWPRWPEVLGVCPYELVDPYGKWPVWDWLYPNGDRHAQYDAVARLPRPAPAPGVLAISLRVRAWAPPGTYTVDVGALAGGAALATRRGLAPVAVQAGTPPPTPVPTPRPDPAAQELLANGGFELDSSWEALVAGRGGYTAVEAHSGARSYWLGLAAGSANAYTFSSVEQELGAPTHAGYSQFRLWYKPVSDNVVGDYFKILVRDASQSYHTLGYLDLSVRGWTQASLTMIGYRAEAVRLTTVNDGFGGRTTVYLDDVSWTQKALDHRYIFPMILKGAVLGARAAELASPPPPAPARPLKVQAYVISGAGACRALAVDPATGLAYAATGDGVWCFDPSGAQSPRCLLRGTGYQAVVVDSDLGRLWVSDWPENAVLALDLKDGREVGRVDRLLRPSGLAIYGDSLFVAETDAAQIVMLDRRTCGIMKSEPVGPAPYVLAVDSEAARVWVANAGGRSLTVLDARTGTPVGAVRLGGLGHPQGVAIDGRRGRVYVTYLLAPRYHALAAIDASTLRIERVLSGNEERPLSGAYGVAIEPGTGRVLLTDVAELLALDPDSLATETTVAGQGPASPFGFAVDGARQRVLVGDDSGPEVRVLGWE